MNVLITAAYIINSLNYENVLIHLMYLLSVSRLIPTFLVSVSFSQSTNAYLRDPIKLRDHRSWNFTENPID